MAFGLRIWTVGIGTMAFAIGLAGSWSDAPPTQGNDTAQAWSFGIAAAEARPAERAAARMDMRTTRRDNAAATVYYDTLPGDCVVRNNYYFCGGVYYQEVNQGGRDVYMVTTP